MKLHAHISKEGELLIPDRAILQNWIKSNQGKDVELEIKVRCKKRSNPQNAFYHGVCIPMVCEGLRQMGHDVDEQDTHEFLKGKFNSKRIVNSDGVVENLPTSTTKLTTVGMMDYIAMIQMWAAEYLGIVIPDPNQQLTIIHGAQVNGTTVIIAQQG